MAEGYTLPVWVAAAARAALMALQGHPFAADQPLDLVEPAEVRPVPVVAAAPLGGGQALAVARCEPGALLDLTRGLVVWVLVRCQPLEPDQPWLQLEAGEGVGVHQQDRALCHSAYARQLLDTNLRPLLPADQALVLRLVFPQGRALAERTSNAAFGVVDGLALIGTQALVQSSAAPDQLALARSELERRAGADGFNGDLVLVIGENGMDLAPRLGLAPGLLLKAGNWLGPLLVAAAEVGVRRLLLFGYHGKLIKLAGGIFHTHHHLADGRMEVLVALAALEGVAGGDLIELHGAATVEAALAGLAARDPAAADRLRLRIAISVEQRAEAYLARYGQQATRVGAVLFDRQRQITAQGPQGQRLWEAFQA